MVLTLKHVVTYFHPQESPAGELSSPLTPVTPPMENINGTDEICDTTPNSDTRPEPAQNALAFAHRYTPRCDVLPVPHFARCRFNHPTSVRTFCIHFCVCRSFQFKMTTLFSVLTLSECPHMSMSAKKSELSIHCCFLVFFPSRDQLKTCRVCSIW